METNSIKLTQYSHGAGCGCKISPKVLDQILSTSLAMPDNDKLIVGNHSKDDAAVYDMGNGTALISTTDFFMPIVDDPYNFGRIASANAISDVYAMGGKPILAIAILGWPINVLAPEVAQKVIEGSRSICMEAGIPLAGGHSIDSPEPIFGLAVNGIVAIDNIKQNNTAQEGDVLFLTKKLGVGILTTAEKKGILKEAHAALAPNQMMQLNKAGEILGALNTVHAMTDVTGFGLLGHLTEMAEGSHLSATVTLANVPLITPELDAYIAQKSIPGGTGRNWESYGHKIEFAAGIDINRAKAILADPQTSGGLLVAVARDAADDIARLLSDLELYAVPIGTIGAKNDYAVLVN
ncbi:selenide, water dikinase SelD [Limnovirga soli]|uniref:Selenide, water dikinase n=1 Tax=Limnovirga soli TaxID=2656915 RepID=A0A8J8FAE9_9BACT|nr:selenide, water dikinase SelD [Limnovirga soli]NNV54130.1 selenide, water dikinase SelD [Limnovirga soli]